MKLKTFKNKLDKISSNIETELEKLRNYSEEIEDSELASLIEELCDNVSLLIVEDTDERPSRINIQRIHDYITELEELGNDYNDNNDD